MADSAKEQKIRRELKRIEFNKLESSALIDFVNQSSSESKRMKKLSARYHHHASEALKLLRSKNLIHKISLEEENLEKFYNSFCDAVDGSNQPYQRPDGGWIYFSSVARIRYPAGYDSDVEVNLAPNIQSVDKNYDKEAAQEAEDLMMSMETKALTLSITSRQKDGGVLFLDGPVIDPPNKAEDYYLKDRTYGIKKAFDRNITVIGIVKRIEGSFCLSTYGTQFSRDEKKHFEELMSDKNFVIHILTNHLDDDKSSVAFTEPIVMAEKAGNMESKDKVRSKIAEKYHEKGVDIITILMCNGYYTNPIRVEVAVPDASNVNKKDVVIEAIKYIVSWAAPGRHLPIPVILAHEKCNIGQGAAEILYSEFISGSKSDNEEENIIQIKMMGEIH